MTDQMQLLKLASKTAAEVMAGIRPGDLERPTPCSEWNLQALLTHMVSGTAEFGRAAGGGTGHGEFTPGPDLVTQFRTESEATLAAWAAAGPEAMVDIGFGPMPAAVAMGIQTGDTTVHAWDVAKALGGRLALPEQLAVAVLEFERELITDELRATVGFDPPVPVPPGADTTDQLVAFLGRQP